MRTPEPSLEDLNAYVDGELDAASRARVAQAIAARPDLARRVAALSAMKDALARDLPEFNGNVRRGGASPRRRWVRAAAAAVFALIAIVAVSAWAPWRADTAPQAWVGQAWEISSALFDGATEAPSAGHVLANLSILGGNAHVPDLSSAQLTVAAVETVPSPLGGDALAVGYVGSRGCQLTLLAFAGEAGLSQRVANLDATPHLIVGWRAGELNYVLMASGMADSRFRLIAQSVSQATIERARFDSETREALRRSRETSPPCQHA
jgi:anti-sigma factor RsiW